MDMQLKTESVVEIWFPLHVVMEYGPSSLSHQYYLVLQTLGVELSDDRDPCYPKTSRDKGAYCFKVKGDVVDIAHMVAEALGKTRLPFDHVEAHHIEAKRYVVRPQEDVG